jgi:ribonuclease P protein component
VLSAPDKMDSPDTSRSFRPAYRLRKTDEYSSVFAFRKAIKGQFFVLHYRPSSEASARLGVVIANKLARQAVQRNFIKRMARELFRHARETLACHDLIFRLHTSPKSATRADLRADMQQVLRRLPR